MASTNGGSNGTMRSIKKTSNGTVRRTKKEPGRRCWRADEEKVLLAALKELVVKGWKSDNGFRCGYVQKLEDAMKVHFPSAGIKGRPHIDSKLTAWKKHYASLVTILSRSGVGFNLKGDNMIDCDDEAWAEVIRVDPEAEKMREKEWPLLEGWKEVFGKDRATGEGAKDVMESVNEMISEHQVFGSVGRQIPDNIIYVEETVEENAEINSFCQSTHGDSQAIPKGKKRKAHDPIEKLCDLLSNIHKDTNIRLQDLAERLGYQADIGKARKEVFPMLQKIPDLTERARFVACNKLVDQTQRLQMFVSLPEEARAAYVHMMLTDGE